jgi:predicted ATP-grasp superfamily ATP-dependent carboligase
VTTSPRPSGSSRASDSLRSSKASVVVVATGAASSTAFLRSLGRRGVHTIAAAEQASVPVFWSRYCDESVRVPSPFADLLGYRDALLSLARRRDVRAIVPVREVDVYVLSTYRSAFARHLAPLWPVPETLRVAQDRIALAGAARAAGVAEPNTRSLESIATWDRESVIKARYAVLTGAYVPSIPEGESREMGKPSFPAVGVKPDRAAIEAELGHTPIVQDHVSGTEYSFRALYDHGEAIVTTQKRGIRGFKYARGPSVYHRSVDRSGLEAAGRALLDSLKWHGPAEVSFVREASTGEYYLLEMNPRFWATLPCDIDAGVDFPRQYWGLATGESDLPDGNYEVGAGTHLLRGECSYLYSVLAEEYAHVEPPRFRDALGDVLSSVVAQPSFDLLSATDPGPFVGDLLGCLPVELPIATRRVRQRPLGLSEAD